MVIHYSIHYSKKENFNLINNKNEMNEIDETEYSKYYIQNSERN